MNRLRWDGKARLDTFLEVYFGVAPSPYATAIGRMFMLSVVARALKPGCKVDYMLILEGPQGTLKSTALKILASEQYFSDNLPDIRHAKPADLSLHLRGKLILEIAEMSAMDRADSSALKQFITRTVERFRPPYGREEVFELRQGVLVGTTNKSVYLRDETGGRRFWPVVVTSIDIAALTRDRDQLLAEAVARFRKGDQWWPDRQFEAEVIQPEQDARYEADAWGKEIDDYLTFSVETTVNEIAERALHLDIRRVGTTETRRIVIYLKPIRMARSAHKSREFVASGKP